jgi:hypothetical protein
MIHKRIALLLVVFYLSTWPIVIMAAEPGPQKTPAETIQSMVQVMKSGEGFAGLMRFVHWGTAFAGLREADRASLQVDSPEALRAVTLAYLSDPGAALEKQLQSRLKEIPDEQRGLLQKFLAQQQDRLQAKLQRVEIRMAASEYSVGEIVVTGDTAVVPLTVQHEGVEETRQISLQLIGSMWYLPTRGQFEEILK